MNTGENINEEMLAAFIDGNCTPLERYIIEQSLKDEKVQEIVDIVDDCKVLDKVNSIDPIDISEAIDKYLKPIEELKELKRNIITEKTEHIL